MKNKAFLLFFILIICARLFAQEVKLDVHDKPLGEVLANLGIEISFNSKALSVYKITLDKSFDSPRQAIDYMLSGKPLVCAKIGNVYVIYSKTDSKDGVLSNNVFKYNGILVDSASGEGLPYGNILTPTGYVVTDESGMFSFKSNSLSTVPVKISYIGYGILDTVFTSGSNTVKLTAKNDSIPGVMISAIRYALIMQSGLKSGENRINHSIARYMPGSSDNSVFTLLRMLPGVRASNEPSVDLLVWGGKSRVTYDGYTLFGMRGFNDNISFVNPYMVKDIRLLKGGYDASFGGSAGAIAEISGADGNIEKPVIKANIGTLTANIYGSVPVNNKGSLSLAYRQTFYHLYKSELLNPFNGNNPPASNGKGNPPASPGRTKSQLVIYPDYAFRDLNLKFSYGSGLKESYYVSLYGADDKFNYGMMLDEETEMLASQHSRQFAGAAGYDRVWGNGSATKFIMNFSILNDRDENVKISPSGRQDPKIFVLDNVVRQTEVKLSHDFLAGQNNKLKTGVNVTHYSASDVFTDSTNFITSVYLTDLLRIGGFNAEAGVRADMDGKNVFWLPRISISKKISNFNITASWGKYSQYLSRAPYFFDEDQIGFGWKLSGPLRSTHAIAGIAYDRDGFLVSAEGYNKKYENSTELINGNIVNTNINLWGADLFIKKSFGPGSLFGSYSLQQSLYPVKEFSHEIKTGAIYGVRNFVFTANYVYGTGFAALFAGSASEVRDSGQDIQMPLNDTPYSRLDCAVTYRKRFRSVRIQTGLSLINLLDNENIKYTFTADNNDPVALYSKAMNFTPMLFFEFLF